jgi:hypothetical protein
VRHDLREELWLASKHFDDRDARTEADTVIDMLVPSIFLVGSSIGTSPCHTTKEDFRDVDRCLCRSCIIQFEGVDPIHGTGFPFHISNPVFELGPPREPFWSNICAMGDGLPSRRLGFARPRHKICTHKTFPKAVFRKPENLSFDLRGMLVLDFRLWTCRRSLWI